MNCPRCFAPLQERSIAQDDATRVTNLLCSRCLYRTVRHDKNNIVALEQKQPVAITAGLPHKRRRPIVNMLAPISTVACDEQPETPEAA